MDLVPRAFPNAPLTPPPWSLLPARLPWPLGEGTDRRGLAGAVALQPPPQELAQRSCSQPTLSLSWSGWEVWAGSKSQLHCVLAL